MENLENPPLEQSERQSENINPPQAEVSFFEKLKTKWPIVLGAIGSLTLFTAIIYAAYSYGKRGQEVQPTPTVALTPTSIPSPQNVWQKFQGSTIEYSIQYPTDWVISEEFDPSGVFLYFIIKNGAYELKYNPPKALTRICIFNDDNEEELKIAFEKDFPGYYDQARTKLEDYVEFDEYRRTEYESEYKEGRFIICKGNIETGFSYIVPIKYDESILSVMDKMVSSFEWVGGPQL